MQETPHLRFPKTIVFWTSFSLMVLELVAGRLMAPYLGVSLYTWTSIIGVVLTGITFGNYIGGRLADRKPSLDVLGLTLVAAAIFNLIVLYMAAAASSIIKVIDLSYVFNTFLFSILVFFLPSFLFSFVTPMVVKLVVRDLKSIGGTVGAVYASSALGSIIGTFATGYFLIAFLGTRYIILITTIILFLMASIILGGKRILRSNAGIPVFLLFFGSIMLPNICLSETQYYCLYLRSVESKNNGTGKALVLDHLTHSYYFPQNPDLLWYDYERKFAALAHYKFTPNDNLRVLFIGGGGYVLPRYIEKNFPKSIIDVAEIDKGVTKFDKEYLDFHPSERMNIFHQDARMFLKELSDDVKYDIIFGDAFNDFSIPYHLTTNEFNQMLVRHLNEDGVYVMNAIDKAQSGRFVSSLYKTLSASFKNVLIGPSSLKWKDIQRDTFVLIASNVELNKERWFNTLQRGFLIFDSEEDKNNDATWALLSEEEIKDFFPSKKAVFLEDAYVPVDNLVAPVFRGAYSK